MITFWRTHLSKILKLAVHETQCVLELRRMKHRELPAPHLVQKLLELSGETLLEAPVVEDIAVTVAVVAAAADDEAVAEAGVVHETLKARVHEAGVAHVAQAAHAASRGGICGRDLNSRQFE